MNVDLDLPEQSLDKRARKHIAIFKFSAFDAFRNACGVFGIKVFKTAQIYFFGADVQHFADAVKHLLPVLRPSLPHRLFESLVGIVDNSVLRQFKRILRTAAVSELRVKALTYAREYFFFPDIVRELRVQFKIYLFQLLRAAHGLVIKHNVGNAYLLIGKPARALGKKVCKRFSALCYDLLGADPFRKQILRLRNEVAERSLLEKRRKKIVKTRLRHPVLSEFGEDIGDIRVKNTVRGKYYNIARGKTVSVPVKQICETVKGDRSLSASRHALNEAHVA